MKSLMRLFLFLIVSVVLFTACDDDSVGVRLAPEKPVDVYTVTGDKQVTVRWIHRSQSEVSRFRVFRSLDNNKFTVIGETSGFIYTDRDVNLKNGVKYYYAVSAVGLNGAESKLSSENAFSTPRSEGFDAVVHDYRKYGDKGNFGGFNFIDKFEVDWFNPIPDFFFDYDPDQKKYFVSVWAPYKIAIMGKTNNIHDIDKAPVLTDPRWNKNQFFIKGKNGDGKQIDIELFSEEVKTGHTYLIYMYNPGPKNKADNYAKIRVTSIGNDVLTFDWAYQDVLSVWELEKRMRSIRNITIDKNVKRIKK